MLLGSCMLLLAIEWVALVLYYPEDMSTVCPKCGSNNLDIDSEITDCWNCGNQWETKHD